MFRGRGWSAEDCRARTRGQRRRAACTAGARSSGRARAADPHCSSSRRFRRRTTRRLTRWSRRRRHCDGRDCPSVPSMALTLGFLSWPRPPGGLPAVAWAALDVPQSRVWVWDRQQGTKCRQGLNLKIHWRHLQRAPVAQEVENGQAPASGRSGQVSLSGDCLVGPSVPLSWF